MKEKYEEYQNSVKVVRNCTAVMDACKTGVHTFTLTQAVNGESPSEEQVALEKLIDDAGLSTGFFDNSDPLYARAEEKRNQHQRYLNTFKLL